MKYIPLSKGQFAVVDDEDYESLSQFKWCLHSNGYAKRHEGGRNNRRCIYMHRMVARALESDSVDHADGNKLNNSRSNLRVCTHQQNCYNTKMHKDNISGKKGVTLIKATGRYMARIQANGKSRHLGVFATPEEASECYAQAAQRLHGEFSKS